MFSFQALYEAYLKCRKRKRKTANAIRFEQNLIENLCDLETSLRDRSYEPSRSIAFLSNSPKLREIFAADFRDRVVHHILIDVIEPFYERKFIYDVYNNRKDKGIHSAVKRAQDFMRCDIEGYYLQLDIKKFFYNLDKNVLFKCLYDDISSKNSLGSTTSVVQKNSETKVSPPLAEKILYLAHRIIYHDPTKNYTFKGDKSKLELFCECKYMLLEWYEKIKEYLRINLALELREDMKLKKNGEGLDFLGYIIRPHYLLVRNRVVNNYKYKKAKFLDSYEKSEGYMSLEEIKNFLSVQASFLGHIKHANSYNLKTKIGEIDEQKYIDAITCGESLATCRVSKR